MDIVGKKISIIGAERSGLGAARLAKRKGAIPFVSDSGKSEKLSHRLEELRQQGIDFETEMHTERVFDADLFVISPGVPSNASVVTEALKRNIEVISELEFAYRFCNAIIIAITGTNGKTTTVSLTHHLLINAGLKSHLAGNIGIAFSDVADTVSEDEFIVLEVSSFQLDHIKTFKPDVACLLNITPDHLNRYDNDFNKYAASKFRIFENQNNGCLLVLNYDCEILTKPGLAGSVRTVFFSTKKQLSTGYSLSNGELVCSNNAEVTGICDADDLRIPGEHNISNALAAIACVKPFIEDKLLIKKGIRSFEGVEHRIELVLEKDGVKYINDSKATNVDSVWYALQSFQQPILLILGGLDKGNDYNSILQLVKQKVKKIYAIGSSSEKVYGFFRNYVNTEIKSSLQECIISASKEASNGDVVLLSPACASFDMFENYEHRGRVFKEAVKELLQ